MLGRGQVNIKKFGFIPKAMGSYRRKQTGDYCDLCFKKLTLVAVWGTNLEDVRLKAERTVSRLQ